MPSGLGVLLSCVCVLNDIFYNCLYYVFMHKEFEINLRYIETVYSLTPVGSLALAHVAACTAVCMYVW